MAVRIPLSSIDKQTASLIDQALTIIPTQERERKNAVPPKPIRFYLPDEEGNVSLPYRIACLVFEKMFHHELEETRFKNIGDHPFMVQFRDEQPAIVEEAFQQLQTYATTSLCVPPGCGKTIMGTWLALVTRLVFCIVVPCMPLVKQWYKTIQTCCPTLLPHTLVMGKLTKDNDRDDIIDDVKVIICLDQRVRKLRQEVKDMVGTLILDEAHLLSTADRVDILLAFRPRYIIAETATMERDDGQHTMIQAMVGNHKVYRPPTKPFLLMKLETKIKVQETYNDEGLDYTQLSKDLADHPEMNQLVVEIVRSNPQHKFIVLSRLAEHVEKLSGLFREHGVSSDTMVRNKTNYTDSQVLVGTMPKIGTGFDEENCCQDFLGVKSNVLILYHSVKKWQNLVQYVGRVCRSSNPYVIWMHGENRIVRSHLKGLGNCVQESQGTIIPMERDNLVLPSHPNEK